MTTPFLVEILEREKLVRVEDGMRVYSEQIPLTATLGYEHNIHETSEGWVEYVREINGNRIVVTDVHVDPRSRIVTDVKTYKFGKKVGHTKFVDGKIECELTASIEGIGQIGVKSPPYLVNQMYEDGIHLFNTAMIASDNVRRLRLTPIVVNARHYRQGPADEDIDALLADAFGRNTFGGVEPKFKLDK